MPHKSDAQFDIESDLRTLVEANRIRKSPKRMKAVKAEAKKQKAVLATVASK